MNNAIKICLAVAVILVIAVIALSWDQLTFQVRQVPGVADTLKETTESQLAKYGEAARGRLKKLFEGQGLQYPPDKIALVAIKSTKQLLLYTASGDNPYQFVSNFAITGLSGGLGPKLTAGDNQVPEGVYLLKLEPNTPFHLALRLNYPNDADVARAKDDGRADPGSDIFIHGGGQSSGSISIDDQNIEDLFVLVNDVRDKTVPLIIAPVDFRQSAPPSANRTDPPWLPVLYTEIGKELYVYPNPGVW